MDDALRYDRFGHLRSVLHGASLPDAGEWWQLLLGLCETEHAVDPEHFKESWIPYMSASSVLRRPWPVTLHSLAQFLLVSQLIPRAPLHVSFSFGGEPSLKAVLSHEQSDRLMSLYCNGSVMTEDASVAIATAFVRKESLPLLERLQLRNMRLGDAFARCVAQATCFTSLRSLDLSGNALGEEGIQALTDAPWVANLSSLSLSQGQLDLAALSQLASSHGMQGLRELDLSFLRLGSGGVVALLVASWLKSLRALNLSGNELGVRGVQHLVGEAPERASCLQVRRLNLGYNAIGSEGALMLAKSECFPHLEQLELWGNQIDDEGAFALVTSPNFPRLRRLAIRTNAISMEGWFELSRVNPTLTLT